VKHDFGGLHGEHAEEATIEPGMSKGLTRCSTSVYAMTKYLCGKNIASYETMPSVFGSDTNDVVQLANESYERYLKTNSSPRLLLRLRVGVAKPEHHVGTSHVWVVLVHQDGTFSWLQSFIGHYSLAGYMAKQLHRLSFTNLVSRLERVKMLTELKQWDDDLYKSLFLAAPASDALSRRMQRGDFSNAKVQFEDLKGREVAYNPVHHKLLFNWDLACELEEYM
jgi:hypothetical protein